MGNRILAGVGGVAVVAATIVAIAVLHGRSVDHSTAPHPTPARISLPPASASVPRSAALARPIACPARPGTGTRRQVEAFPAAAVIWCMPGERSYPDGEWTVLRKQVSVGPIDSFVAALERQDEPMRPGVACAAIAFVPMQLLLVAPDGRTISPRLPTDGCNFPQQQAITALHRLHFVTVSVVRTQLEQSAPAITARCEMGWKNENALSLDDSSGVSELGPGRLRVCWYGVHADPQVGEFERGATLDAARSARLRTALAEPRHTADCLPQRHFAVVFAPGGAYANVELGGCYRVSMSGRSDGQADQAVVRAILG